MKRKRGGHKKGKHKQSLEQLVGDNIEQDTCSLLEDQQDLDNNNNNNAHLDSQRPVDSHQTPVALLSGNPPPPPPPPPPRVKVKLKSSHSAHTHSGDTDKSSSHLSFGKQEELPPKINDLADLLPQMQPAVSVYSSRKAASIKIKSSRGVSSVTTPISQTCASLQNHADRSVDSDKHMRKSVGEMHYKEHKYSPHQLPRYDQSELTTALEVIRKIMKMDAAEPFNAPVDPVALGIPDYFDIIEIPMDFGTICNNLELGHTYKNSEDVFMDVQYIWENCFKYNNKGDYIVDLMKRVKKNFMKYWTAAGLYFNQPNKANVGEGIQVDSVVPSSHERGYVKGTYTKLKKRGRHGYNKHKGDCLCAVCVVRRRRREREGNAKVAETQIEISDGNTSQEFRQEEETYADNHYSEDASSNLNHSPDPDDEADTGSQAEKMKLERPEKQGSPRQEINDEAETQKTSESDHSDHFQHGDGSGEELNPRSRSEEVDDSLIMIKKHNSKYYGKPPHQKEDPVKIQKLQRKHESLLMQRQTTMCKNFLIDRNPSVMKLCGVLFPSNPKSVWRGPHSLGHHDVPVRKSSAISAAVEMFMK